MQKVTKFNHKANSVYDAATIPAQYVDSLKRAYADAGVELPEYLENQIAQASPMAISADGPSYEGMPAADSSKVVRLMNTGTDDAPNYVPYLADADSGLEVREDVSLLNASVRCAYYLNSRGVQCSFQPGETEEDGTVPISIFENFVCNECRFTDMPEEAVIRFKGSNLFNQSTFRATQRLCIEGAKNVFSDCRNVHIIFGDTLTTTEIEATGTDIDLTTLTSAQVTKIRLKLTLNGGTLRLPAVTIPATWQIIANGTYIYAPQVSYGQMYGLQATGCWIQARDSLALQLAQNCTLCFNGTTATSITLAGGVYIGNVIQSGTFDSQNTTKRGVTFAADICIGNRVNMYYGDMTQHRDCAVCIGNYNGGDVLAANSQNVASTTEAFKKAIV